MVDRARLSVTCRIALVIAVCVASFFLPGCTAATRDDLARAAHQAAKAACAAEPVIGAIRNWGVGGVETETETSTSGDKVTITITIPLPKGQNQDD